MHVFVHRASSVVNNWNVTPYSNLTPVTEVRVAYIQGTSLELELEGAAEGGVLAWYFIIKDLPHYPGKETDRPAA